MYHNSVKVNVKLLHQITQENPPAPATLESAGCDLRACIEEDELFIAAGEKALIPAGISIEILCGGIAGFVYSRSGLGTKKGLTVSQGVGVIDPDYRGEIKVSLLNTSGKEQKIERGQRIAQLVLQPFSQPEFVICEELGTTDRGAGGFGSTGKK
ncbi:MAG: dUTP diphosphatase [Desulfovibrio sp.]